METHIYRDFDAFKSSVRDVDCTMLLQNPKRHIWSIDHTYLPELHVQLGRLGSGNIVEGQCPSAGYLLYLPLTDECAYSANAMFIEKNAFMVLEPGCEFCISTKAEHDWCSIFVPTQRIVHGGDLGKPNSGSEGAICRVSHANRQLAHRFMWLVNQAMIAASCSQFESSPAAIRAEAELVEIATLIVGSGQAAEPNQEGRPKIPRREIIRRSMELLRERDMGHVLVGDLAAAAGVSERTLRTAFHEYFGVGPVRYLQLTRLHQVHRALKAAEPEAGCLTDILLQLGVWEFGRFASRYRQLFGEPPSETLRTKIRRSAVIPRINAHNFL